MRLHLLLDSGAVTNKGAKPKDRIRLRDYVPFCLENAAHVEKFVALDEIPTRRTRTRFVIQ